MPRFQNLPSMDTETFQLSTMHNSHIQFLSSKLVLGPYSLEKSDPDRKKIIMDP